LIVAVFVTLAFTALGRARSDGAPSGALAYIAWDGKSACLRTVDLRGQNARRLACGKQLGQFTGGLEPSVTWSHNGRELAFIDVGRQPGVYVVDAKGHGLTRAVPLNSRDAEFPYSPALAPGTWSPDDTRLAVDRWQGRENVACTKRVPLQRRLAVADVPQHKLVEIRALSRPRVLKTLGPVEWLPDGQGLLYVVNRNLVERNEYTPDFPYCTQTAASLYTINADGRGRHLLLTARSITYAAGSPDDTSVAWTGCATKAAVTCGLHLAESDGTNDRLLARNQSRYSAFGDPGVPGLHLAWTPSGTEIVAEGGGLNVIGPASRLRRRLPIPSLEEKGSDCGVGYGSFAISNDGAWAGGLSREDYVFDDCKDPYFVEMSVVPLAGPARKAASVRVKSSLDSISLFLSS
jgi:hypothetical protein